MTAMGGTRSCVSASPVHLPESVRRLVIMRRASSGELRCAGDECRRCPTVEFVELDTQRLESSLDGGSPPLTGDDRTYAPPTFAGRQWRVAARHRRAIRPEPRAFGACTSLGHHP